MSIEQKVLEKLRPHAKRINDGIGNDFDYFPAVLLQVLEDQKAQSTASGAFSVASDQKWKSYDAQIANLIGSIHQTSASAIELQRDARDSLAQKITACDDGIVRRLGNMQETLAGHIIKAGMGQSEKLIAIEKAIVNLSAAFEIEHRKSRKFLIATIVALVLGFGICIALLVRR